jgi:hypothetical protein
MSTSTIKEIQEGISKTKSEKFLKEKINDNHKVNQGQSAQRPKKKTIAYLIAWRFDKK